MKSRRLSILIVFLTFTLFTARTLRADSLGQVTIQGTTYDIYPQAEVKSPAAKFKLGSKYYALKKSATPATLPIPPSDPVPASSPPVEPTPATTPPFVPTTNPSTQPTPAPSTQPAATTRPSAANTGVPAGTVLRPGGNLNVIAGAVLDGHAFAGTQTVKLAKGETVTFRHCRIDGAGQPYGVRCDGNLGTVVVDHCEILNVASAAVCGDHFIATANYIHRSGGDGFKPGTDALIQGNYVTELGWNSPAAHADGVQIRGGSNIRIVGNFFDLPRNIANTKANAAVFLQLAATNVTFDGNWCLGGNFAVHAYADGAGGPTVKITNNIFTANSTQYGFGSIGAGVVWTGNVTDAGKPAKPADH